MFSMVFKKCVHLIPNNLIPLEFQLSPSLETSYPICALILICSALKTTTLVVNRYFKLSSKALSNVVMASSKRKSKPLPGWVGSAPLCIFLSLSLVFLVGLLQYTFQNPNFLTRRVIARYGSSSRTTARDSARKTARNARLRRQKRLRESSNLGLNQNP